MKNVKLTTFIDLFAGIGGFRLAFEKLGLKCVFSSEIDKHAQKTYYENFGEIPAGDITKIKESEIPQHDILCAGFPCQAFSISGKRLGFEDTRGTLFFDIARIAKCHKPKVIFLENVKNFKKHNNGKTFDAVLKVLDNLGYRVFYKVLNASRFGVPTARERIYLVCFRKDIGNPNFAFPEPTRKNVYLKDILEKNIDDSEYEIKRNDIKINKNQIATPKMSPIQIGTINNGGQGERIYSVYGHAITLSAHGGGAAAKTGAYVINGKIRKLTPRECARVMGFPDSFKIATSKSQAYKQFGNSVAVPVVSQIAKNIIQTKVF
ncbi:MAG: DNA cytosine methyltransferase [Nanoarchaeota archaeon]|nr:DNA cytosine methyltransferase [Nanoarchaeota archaeon]MBU4123976.1 DNA cytosine methyltransferase [Nanoarchaeota archaeon]